MGSEGGQRTGLSRAAAGGIFLVSFSLIALQLFYMRSLSVLRYHHFSYLVISTALLGFGASGTFLSFAMPALRKDFYRWALRFFFLFTLSIPFSLVLSRLLPIDIRYLFYSGSQLALLGLYNLLMFLPFFFGACLIGLFLARFSAKIPFLYGVNLIGSGLGGLGALAIMGLVPAARLPAVAGLVAFAAQLLWTVHLKAPAAELPGGQWKNPVKGAGRLRCNSREGPLLLLAGAVACAAGVFLQPGSGVDQYRPWHTCSVLRSRETPAES